MHSPPRGEVWLVDLGWAAKVRPCLVLSVPIDDVDRVLVTLVPHTTKARGSRFEVSVNQRFLDAGVFDAQNLVTIQVVKLLRKLGKLTEDEMVLIASAVRHWLGLSNDS